jgi:hypothetical protein
MEGYYRTSSLFGYADNEVLCLCSGCADFNGQNDFWEPIMEPDKCEICEKDVFGEDEREFFAFLKEAITPSFECVYDRVKKYMDDQPDYSFKKLFYQVGFDKGEYLSGAFYWRTTKEGHDFWKKLNKDWVDHIFQI